MGNYPNNFFFFLIPRVWNLESFVEYTNFQSLNLCPKTAFHFSKSYFYPQPFLLCKITIASISALSSRNSLAPISHSMPQYVRFRATSSFLNPAPNAFNWRCDIRVILMDRFFSDVLILMDCFTCFHSRNRSKNSVPRARSHPSRAKLAIFAKIIREMRGRNPLDRWSPFPLPVK